VGIDPFFVVQRPSPKGGGFLFEKSSSGHPGRKICLENGEWYFRYDGKSQGISAGKFVWNFKGVTQELDQSDW
jgi:hypothetical protein